MELKRYEEIRDESKKAVQDFLNDLPEHFTMMHLEVLKVTFQEELEKKMSDLKMKTKLRYIRFAFRDRFSNLSQRRTILTAKFIKICF